MLTRGKNIAQNYLNCYHYISLSYKNSRKLFTDKVILNSSEGNGLHKNIIATENKLLLAPQGLGILAGT